ncbi:exonuclease, partial [Toxoplasma gondii GAB2-2007-GAL-DOM2]
PAFSPCSAWASSSFAALEDAFSTSPMHAKGGGSPQPRAGREGTRGAWGVRSLRFYEDIALVLSSLSSASEDETSDELISNGDGSQEGAESEGADEEETSTFSALARRTRIFCGLLLEHLHEDLKDSSSQVAPSFSSPIDFLFHLRDTPGPSAERGDEVDVASEFFLPLRYPHKEISETSCSSSSSPSCSSSAAASFSSCSSTDPGDAPRSPASSLSFAQVLEHSLRVYGVRKRETKRQRESVPRAGSPDGGLREEATAVSASSRDTVTGEERSVREEKRSREQDIGGRETRNGEEKEQDESPLSAYPPLLFIDSNLESEADAAHWRARVRGRRAPRGVCTPEEAAREGGEEGKRSRPAFLCEEFWVKLQSSGEAEETE